MDAPHAERLTALDTGFLVAESARTPMHLGALVTVERAPFADDEGRIRLDEIRRHVSERLDALPRLRQVLRDIPLTLGRPVWVDDADFEIEHHVRLLELPAPGDDGALLRLTEEVAMSLLDRTRPLWEWWVVDGLDDGGVRGGRLAMIVKMHHCLVDGVGGVEVLAAFTDLAADRPIATSPWTARPRPSDARLVTSSVMDGIREPWRIARAVRALARTGRSGAERVTGSIATAVGAVRPSTVAPSLSLNRPIGHRRRLRTLTFDLGQLKAVAHDHHTRLNDVVLTVVTGGLRALLSSRGEPLAEQHVQALVPENLRDQSGRGLGNRITGFFVPLPIDLDDPIAILHEVTTATRRRRRDHADTKAADLLAAADHVPYPLVRIMGPVINAQPWVNTLVTNVPGPTVTLRFADAPILSIAPLVPLSGNLTIGVAALSYRDDLTLTVAACRDACPDIDVMIDGMTATVDALLRDSVNR